MRSPALVSDTRPATGDAAAQALWETRWLRLLVCGPPAPEAVRAAELLSRADGDWRLLLQRFAQETLVPRAQPLFEQLPAGTVPAEARTALRDHLVQHAARSLLSLRQLRRVTSALEAAGIEVLTFKGPALGVVAYGDKSARTYQDLDLLVACARRHGAAAVLRDLGYVPDWPVATGTGSFLRYGCAVAFQHERESDLDLHWGFSTPLVPFTLDRTGLHSRSRTIDLGGFAVTTLGPEDTLLHACVHAARDDWIYWRAHADVAALLRAADALNWRLLRHLARQTGTTRMLRIGLLLAALGGRAELSAAVLSWARSDPRAVAQAADYQARADSGRPAPQGTRRRLTRAMGLRERMSDKVLTVLGAVAKATEPRADETWAPWTWPLRRPLRLLRDVRGATRTPLGGYRPPPSSG